MLEGFSSQVGSSRIVGMNIYIATMCIETTVNTNHLHIFRWGGSSQPIPLFHIHQLWHTRMDREWRWSPWSKLSEYEVKHPPAFDQTPVYRIAETYFWWYLSFRGAKHWSKPKRTRQNVLKGGCPCYHCEVIWPWFCLHQDFRLRIRRYSLNKKQDVPREWNIIVATATNLLYFIQWQSVLK